MSLDITTFTMPCSAGQQCRHQICKHCANLLRSSSTRVADHPGTQLGVIKESICQNCARKTRRDQRLRVEQGRLDKLDQLNTTDERVQYAAPGIWAMLQRRRKNGVPATGDRRKETA